jgi:hypothetical protein
METEHFDVGSHVRVTWQSDGIPCVTVGTINEIESGLGMHIVSSPGLYGGRSVKTYVPFAGLIRIERD